MLPLYLGWEKPRMLTVRMVIKTKNNWTPVEARAQKTYLYFGGRKTLPATNFHPEVSILSANEFLIKKHSY